ncbi:acyl-CoA synthetase/AMP-acid ligase [Cryptosporangium arvum DSM 44712]|uniref:Acyl-CoA synthetase/AMP-acid ligase n=2 Tax=Cryptosporangium TaxID=65502 RepID=A0A010YPF9_9ACTN|nr:AMP-binding protein [Cryptosporangium arvum]EXG82080.1 acyl-CoA synthetase/AMP-acid ligase [Cryptosporangium arvum DSM 44712]
MNDWLHEAATADADAAWLLCDRHDPDAVAFRVVAADLSIRSLSYGELADRSRRLATVLRSAGVEAGHRVAVLMGKRLELPVALLAIWRLGAIHVPLFTAFAPDAISARLTASGVRLAISEPGQAAKLEGVAVVSVNDELDARIRAAEPLRDRRPIGGGGQLVELYTSGTTGAPKAVPVPVRALAAFRSYLHYGLDVTEDDVYWNAADPGWAYGLYYAILGPLAHGRANLLVEGGFDPRRTLEVMNRCGVTNFAGAPTMYRALRGVGTARLRRASSAGEPLTPDVTAWAPDALGTEVRDHYGQTEQGMVILNGWHASVRSVVESGSMGRPLPGFTATVLDGQIALDVEASPLMWFEGYVDAPERTRERFTADGRYYLTGDTGRVDENGAFYFTARDDDVILAAGYRIGPFDVESVLVTHPAVADVAVVGAPDELRGEIVVAYVVLADGESPGPTFLAQLQDLVRTRYSAHAYPRQVHVVESLPKTASGKIQRFVLRRGTRSA